MNILVLAPHADDEVIGCGGTIARHIERGDHVRVVVMTSPSSLAASSRYAKSVLTAALERRREATAAGKILGCEIAGANFPEVATHSYGMADMVAVISRHVLETEPHTVYTSHPADINQDHRMVYECTMIACRPFSPPPSVRRVLAYHSDVQMLPGSALAANIATRLTNHEATMKMRAFDAYASEQRQPPHPRSREKMLAWTHALGAKWSADAAEEFTLLWEINE